MAIAGLLLTVLAFRPAESVLEASLDSSNFSSYAYFTAHGFRFGRDVVAVSGPYGFINYGFVYGGELYWTRFALELVVKAAFAALVIWFFRHTSARLWRWLWLAAVFATAALIEDTPYDLCILLGGIYLLLYPDGSRRPIGACLVAALLALLSLCKGTQVVFSLGTIGLAAFEATITRRYRRGIVIAASYATAFVVFWLLAGQNLLDIPAFLRGVQETASGYNNAMTLDEPFVTTRVGLLVLGSLTISSIIAAWICRRSLAHLLVCIFFAGFVFTQWKHGFVRADGHVFIFFIFAVPAALIPGLVVPTAAPRRGFLPVGHQVVAAASLIIGVYAACYCGSQHVWLEKQRTALPPRITQLLHPAATKVRLETALDFSRTKYSLPALHEKIRGGSVDFFGSDHGFIPLNGFRYQPRPVGGGCFTVYTEYLKKLNEQFLLDPARRPDFYLVKPQILDERWLSQDDSRSIPPLLFLYRPVATDRSVVLFQKNPAGAAPPAPVAIEHRTFRWGETVGVPVLPADSHDIILATFQIELNWLGRLRAFFYKPPKIFLDFSAPKMLHPNSNRLIPAMARSPIIISPALEDVHDFLGLYGNAPGKRVQDFRVLCPTPGLFRANRLRVTFYRLPRPPADPNAAAISALARFPCSNIGAELVEPPAFPHYLDDGYVVGFHAPSRAVFPLDGTERAANMTFGLEPAAYTNKGTTNGVTFILELTQPGLDPQTIYRRHVDPLKNPRDRGPQTERVVFPPFRAGSKLALLADPGPFGDNAWDWSYVTKFEIQKGPFLLEQFPGFTTAPVAVDGAYVGALDTGVRSVFMLNAPGRIVFALNGSEHTFAFSGGFMPGAYTGDGHSDGAVFVAELRRPDGNVQPLVRRLLNPRITPADRGLQNFSASIPACPAGTQLIIRTDPGAANDTSWDWTYVCDFHFNP